MRPKRERDREDAQELKATDTDMFDRAEEMARMQQGPSDAPVQPASAQPVIAEEVAADAAIPLSEKNAMRSTAQFAVAPAVCDEEARGEAETWLDCIEEFEGGRHDRGSCRRATTIRRRLPKLR